MMAMRSLQPPCIRNREPKANEPDGHEDHPRNEAMIYAVAGHLGLTPDGSAVVFADGLDGLVVAVDSGLAPTVVVHVRTAVIELAAKRDGEIVALHRGDFDVWNVSVRAVYRLNRSLPFSHNGAGDGVCDALFAAAFKVRFGVVKPVEEHSGFKPHAFGYVARAAHADITTSTSARMKQAQARNVSRLSDIMRLPYP